jgi:CubicO group peptidase (beta-lactamase class C family)
MKRMLVLCLVALTVAGSFRLKAEVTNAQAPPTNPPAVFADPQRRAKLQTAFPEIDRLVADFMKRTHVPGAAWGIVIDGELAHVGVAGVRDVPAKAPVDRNTVFRIASMTKSFTAMAIL